MNAYIDGSAAINITTIKPKFDILDGYRSTVDTPAAVHSKAVSAANDASTTVSSHTYTQLEKVIGATVSLIALVVLCYSMVGFVQSSHLHQTALDSMVTVETRVQAGESLWTIAENNPIEGFSTQEVVQIIRQENSLESSMLQPGQTLLVPHTFA